MADQRRPNILVSFGDDIGMWNVGIYTHGMMGRSPNIDRIGAEVQRSPPMRSAPDERDSCTLRGESRRLLYSL